MAASLFLIRSCENAAVALHPLRLSILERLAEPGSATTLAPELNLPRQMVNYHLRELEKAGLVEFVEERKKGNCMERLFRSTTRGYVIAPSALGGASASPERVNDHTSSDYQVAVGARLIQDLADLRRDASAVSTLTLETEIAFESDQARHEFARDLSGMVSQLAAKYHSGGEGAKPFRLIVAAHPANKKENKDGSEV